jgi:hypothetical protein
MSCKISKVNYFKFASKQILFSKCKIKISRFIVDLYSFTKLKIKAMREWSLNIIICLSSRQNTLRGNGQYKGATLCLEGKSIPSRKKERYISYNKTRGHFGLQKTTWSFHQVTPNVFSGEMGVMNDPLKLYDKTENLEQASRSQ